MSETVLMTGTIDDSSAGSPQIATGTICEDPFDALGDDALVRIRPQVFGGAASLRAVPGVVDNWTFFDGAVCAILVSSSSGASVEGTAIMIAPGLALTATHVLEDWLDVLASGDATALVVGPRGDELDIWKGRAVTATGTDITYLSLDLASAINDDWTIRTLPCTTRRPAIGELVHVFGFRVEREDIITDPGVITLRGDLYASAGHVVEIYRDGRDSLLMPYPVIEIACGTLGGMSGGAVIDSRGFLVGVTSRGWSHEDGMGPSYASWLIGALHYPVTLTWPKALGRPAVRVLDIPADLLHLEGRAHLRAVGDDGYG